MSSAAQALANCVLPREGCTRDLDSRKSAIGFRLKKAEWQIPQAEQAWSDA